MKNAVLYFPMCLPDSCHGDKGPPESFTDTYPEASWKFIRVTLRVLKGASKRQLITV